MMAFKRRRERWTKKSPEVTDWVLNRFFLTRVLTGKSPEGHVTPLAVRLPVYHWFKIFVGLFRSTLVVFGLF